MEIEFRDKKKYCKDADMYLFDMQDTNEHKFKVRKIVKIILIVEVVMCFVIFQMRIPLFGQKSYVKTSLPGLVFTGLLLTAGIMIGFFILNKFGFDLAEKRGRNLLSKIGGRNYEKYVDADVRITLNEDKIIWTRESEKLNIRYEDIRKVEDTDEYIYIVINPQSVIWIPIEAFISIEAKRNFLNYVQLKV